MEGSTDAAKKDECKHVYQHFETIYSGQHYQGTYCYYWKRTDRFHCTFCLDIQEVIKTEQSTGEKPEWYQGGCREIR